MSRRPKRSSYKNVAGRVAKVSELKAGLSAYLERVKRGEEVVVTERGTAIAKLVPLAANDARRVGWDRIRQLERQGRVIVRGTGRVPDDFWTMPLPRVPDGSLVSAVLEEREEGW